MSATTDERDPVAEDMRRLIDALGDLWRKALQESANNYREAVRADYPARFVDTTKLIAENLDPMEDTTAPTLKQVTEQMAELEVTAAMFYRVWPMVQQFAGQFHRAYGLMNEHVPWIVPARVPEVWDALGFSLVGEMMDVLEIACDQDGGSSRPSVARVAELRAKYGIPPW